LRKAGKRRRIFPRTCLLQRRITVRGAGNGGFTKRSRGNETCKKTQQKKNHNKQKETLISMYIPTFLRKCSNRLSKRMRSKKEKGKRKEKWMNAMNSPEEERK